MKATFGIAITSPPRSLSVSASWDDPHLPTAKTVHSMSRHPNTLRRQARRRTGLSSARRALFELLEDRALLAFNSLVNVTRSGDIIDVPRNGGQSNPIHIGHAMPGINGRPNDGLFQIAAWDGPLTYSVEPLVFGFDVIIENGRGTIQAGQTAVFKIYARAPSSFSNNYDDDPIVVTTNDPAARTLNFYVRWDIIPFEFYFNDHTNPDNLTTLEVAGQFPKSSTDDTVATWSFDSKPAESSAGFSPSATSRFDATFTADVPGDYVVRLTIVHDGTYYGDRHFSKFVIRKLSFVDHRTITVTHSELSGDTRLENGGVLDFGYVKRGSRLTVDQMLVLRQDGTTDLPVAFAGTEAFPATSFPSSIPATPDGVLVNLSWNTSTDSPTPVLSGRRLTISYGGKKFELNLSGSLYNLISSPGQSGSRSIPIGGEVVLDGSFSEPSVDSGVPGVAYEWTLLGGGASDAILLDADKARARLIPSRSGRYSLQLKVTANGESVSNSIELQVTRGATLNGYISTTDSQAQWLYGGPHFLTSTSVPRGIVLERESGGTPIPPILIPLDDQTGRYSFSDVEDGDYLVRAFSHDGRGNKDERFSVESPTRLHVSYTETSTPRVDLVLKANRVFRDGGTKEFNVLDAIAYKTTGASLDDIQQLLLIKDLVDVALNPKRTIEALLVDMFLEAAATAAADLIGVVATVDWIRYDTYDPRTGEPVRSYWDKLSWRKPGEWTREVSRRSTDDKVIIAIDQPSQASPRPDLDVEYAQAPVSLVVADAFGRRLGVDGRTGEPHFEVDGEWMFTGVPDGFQQYLILTGAASDHYVVSTFGTSSGLYQLTISAVGYSGSHGIDIPVTPTVAGQEDVIRFDTRGTVGAPVSIGPGRISGRAWADDNADGTLQEMEGPAPSSTVFVDRDRSGTFDPWEDTLSVGDDGSFELSEYPAGQYDIVWEVPTGWYGTFPERTEVSRDGTNTPVVLVQNVEVATDGTVTGGPVLFGAAPAPGVVSGILFHDVDADGVRGPGDVGVPAKLVYADANGSGHFDAGEISDFTDDSGAYRLEGLSPGSYPIRARIQSDLAYSTSISELAVQPDANLRWNLGVFSTGADGGEFPVNTTLTGDQSEPQVAATADGRSVVVWGNGPGPGDEHGVFGQRYDSNGVEVGGEFRLNTYTIGAQDSPDVAMDGDGDFVATWASLGQYGSTWGIYAQRFDATGDPIGNEFLVTSTTSAHESFSRVASDAQGNFVVAWHAGSGDEYDILARRFDSNGVPLGPEFLVNQSVAGVQYLSDLSMNAAGDWVVTWQDRFNPGVYVRYFSASGVRRDELLVDPVTEKWAFPHGAIGADGGFVVSWAGLQPNGGYAPYVRRYDSMGNAVDATRVLAETTHAGVERSTALATTGDGEFVVAWGNVVGEDRQIWAQRFDGSGPELVKLGGEHRVNVFESGIRHGMSLAADSAGGFVIAWQYQDTKDGPTDVFARRYELPADQTGPLVTGVFANGDPAANIEDGDRLVSHVERLLVTFSEPLMSTTSADDVTNPALWSLWRGDQQIVGGVQAVRYGWDSATGHYEADLFLDANGSQAGVTALIDGSYELRLLAEVKDIAGNLLDGDASGAPGDAFRRSFRIATPRPALDEPRVNTQWANNQQEPQLALWSDGAAVVVWKSEGQEPNQINGTFGIYGQLFELDGTPRGGEFTVNTVLEGSQDTPSVATANNLFVVVWTTPVEVEGGLRWDIRGRLFAGDGTPLGSEFDVFQPEPGYPPRCRVAMDHTGNFVVVWQSKGRDADDVFARRFNATGVSLGDAFPVNANVIDLDQSPGNRDPDVAMDANGNFVVVWTAADGSGLGVFGQVFDATGNRIGAEFAVNSRRGGRQFAPEIAMAPSGRFVVTWHTTLTADEPARNRYIAAQVFDARGNKLGSELVVNQQTPNSDDDELGGPPAVAVDVSGDFVVTWTLPQPPHSEVRARRFSAAGVPQGDEFVVNRTLGFGRGRASVGMNAVGDFVVAFEKFTDDGSGYSVWMRQFSEVVPGDADLDGDVDLSDFGLFKAGFGTVNALPTDGDFDGDRDVDLTDFGIIKAYFGTSSDTLRSPPSSVRQNGKALDFSGRLAWDSDTDWWLEPLLDDESVERHSPLG